MRQTCFRSLAQAGEGAAAAASLPVCEAQNACCVEEVDANPCHGQGSFAAKEVRSPHEEEAPNDETTNDLSSVAGNYAEGEDSGEARSCSRLPLLNIRTAPGYVE